MIPYEDLTLPKIYGWTRVKVNRRHGIDDLLDRRHMPTKRQMGDVDSVAFGVRQ